MRHKWTLWDVVSSYWGWLRYKKRNRRCAPLAIRDFPEYLQIRKDLR